MNRTREAQELVRGFKFKFGALGNALEGSEYEDNQKEYWK